MAVEVPTVLQLQGGSPQMKVGTVLAEKLKLVKALEGGGLGNLLSGLMGGQGLASIMQNPLAGVVAPLLAQVQQMIAGQDAGSSPAQAPSALYTSLTALSAALMEVDAAAAGLAGVGPPAPTSPLDVVLHAITQESAGSPPPAALSLTAVLAPHSCAPLLASVVEQAQAEVNGAGRPEVIDTLTSLVTAVAAGSASAVSGLRSIIVTLATAQAFGGLIAGGPGAVLSTGEVLPGDASIQDWLRRVIQPTAYAQLAAAAENLSYAPPVELGEVAPLINVGNSFYGTVTWTTGGSGAPRSPQAVEVI